MPRGIRQSLAAGILCGLACSAMAQQGYPNRPLTVVVATLPGTSTETEGRIHLNKVSEYVGQPVVFDFRAGASSVIGMSYVAKAAPDGYTFMLMGSAFALVPLMDVELPFNGLNAFAPVSLMSKRWGAVVVNASLPVNNAREFVAYAKARPGTINYGTSGAGKGLHLAGAWMNSLIGSDMTFIHYKGGGAMQTDLVAGRVHVVAMTVTSAAPLLKAGKIKLLGTANLVRNPAYPDVPTLDEQGWKDFEYSSWLGLTAPSKTPPIYINRISSELAKAVKSPDVVKKLSAETQLVGSTPEEFGRLVTTETERVRRLLKENNIKLEME